ncbi:MAG: hypothetical protein RPT95_12700 [Candidatus Sedimenticola sp. (ex Thyasira tokunagai)]
MRTEQYFYRLNAFTRRNDEVSLINKDNLSETVSVEPWMGTVIALADGQHTIAELISYLAGCYEGDTPDTLENTIGSVIERLVESEIIQLSDTTVELPYHLSRALEELDPAIAKPLLDEDGYKQAQTSTGNSINTH